MAVTVARKKAPNDPSNKAHCVRHASIMSSSDMETGSDEIPKVPGWVSKNSDNFIIMAVVVTAKMALVRSCSDEEEDDNDDKNNDSVPEDTVGEISSCSLFWNDSCIDSRSRGRSPPRTT